MKLVYPLLAVSLYVTSLFAAAPAPPTTAAKLTDLEAQISRLREEMAKLRVQLTALEASSRPAPTPAPATPDPAMEAEVARLGQAIKRLEEQIGELTDGVDRLSEGEGRRPTLTVYGSLDGTFYRGEKSVFDGKAFELVLSGRPHKRLGFFAEIEFEQAAGVGGERGGEIVVEQAYANLAFTPAFNLRAGILLVPFGNVSIDHYAPARDVITKPIVSWAIAPSDWTDNGVGGYGRALLGRDWVLDYEAYAIAGLGAEIDATGTRLARQGYGVDNNGNRALVGRVAAARLSRLQFGLSGYTGKYDDAGRLRLQGFAFDTMAKLGPLTITGEYNALTAAHSVQPDLRLRGYYARAVLGLGSWILPRVLKRDFDEPRFDLVFQYDDVKIEQSVRNRERRITGGLNYRPARQWVLKLNYEDSRAEGTPLQNGNLDGFRASIAFVF